MMEMQTNEEKTHTHTKQIEVYETKQFQQFQHTRTKWKYWIDDGFGFISIPVGIYIKNEVRSNVNLIREKQWSTIFETRVWNNVARRIQWKIDSLEKWIYWK